MNTLQRRNAIVHVLTWGFMPVDSRSRASKHDAETTLEGFAAAVSWLSAKCFGVALEEVTPAELDLHGYQYFRQETGETIRVRLRQAHLGAARSEPLRVVLAAPQRPADSGPQIDEGPSPLSEGPSDQPNQTQTDDSAMLTQAQHASPVESAAQCAPASFFASTDTAPVLVTAFTGSKAPQGEPLIYPSWPEFAARLADTVRTSVKPIKDQLVAFAPCHFASNYRNGANAFPSTVAVIDCDKLTHQQYASILQQLERARLDAVVYTSPSDDPSTGVRRCRVIVRTDRPIEPSESRLLRSGLANDLEVLGDPSCEGDAARLFFIGRIDGTPPREVHTFSGGRSLPVDLIIQGERERGGRETSISEKRDPRDEYPDAVRSLGPTEIEAVVGTLLPLGVQDEKHEAMVAFGAFAASRGWSNETIEAVARELLSQWPDVKDLEAGVRTALECVKYQGPNDGAGYHALRSIAERIGIDAVAFGESLEALPNPIGEAKRAEWVEAKNAERAEWAMRPEEWDQFKPTPGGLAAATPTNDVTPAAPAPKPAPANPFDRMLAASSDDGAALAAPLPEQVYLCRELGFMPGPPFVIAARSGVGKSMLANTILAQVEAGDPVLEKWNVTPRPGTEGVVLISLEMSAYQTRKRWQETYAGLRCDLSHARITSFNLAGKPFRYRDPSRRENELSNLGLKASLVKALTGKRLAVIDPLKVFYADGDENASEFRNVLDFLASASEESGCPIIVLHHAGKGNRDNPADLLRGTAAIFDAAEGVFTVTREDDGGALTLSHIKNRSGVCLPPTPLEIRDCVMRVAERDAIADLANSEPKQTAEQKVERCKTAITSHLQSKGLRDVVTLRELQAMCCEKQSVVKRACKELVEIGALNESKDKGGEPSWRRGPHLPGANEQAGMPLAMPNEPRVDPRPQAPESGVSAAPQLPPGGAYEFDQTFAPSPISFSLVLPQPTPTPPAPSPQSAPAEIWEWLTQKAHRECSGRRTSKSYSIVDIERDLGGVVDRTALGKAMPKAGWTSSTAGKAKTRTYTFDPKGAQ